MPQSTRRLLHGALQAYGAGVLSSYGELLHSTSPTNPSISIKPWDPEEAANEVIMSVS